MTCPLCYGRLECRPSVHTISRSNYHLMIYELPVWLCQQCGEALYTESQVDALDELVHNTDHYVATLLEASPGL